MTIPTEAIEAAKSALCDIGLHSQEGGLDGPFGVRFVEGPVDQVITTILTAALPALERQIRAQVAEEIRAYLDGFNSHGLPYRDGVYAGINSAAQIARGEQA